MSGYGEGSEGVEWQAAPGFTYAGDSWCWTCNSYRPAEKPVNGGPARVAQHGGCPGSLQPANVNPQQHREE